MKTLIAMVSLALIACGMEHVPRKTFTLITKEGKEIRLTCPVVSSSRDDLTYVTDGHCVVEPD